MVVGGTDVHSHAHPDASASAVAADGQVGAGEDAAAGHDHGDDGHDHATTEPAGSTHGRTAASDASAAPATTHPHTDDAAAGPAAAVPAVPYDPTKPIDLGGVPGVTPEQQAAAENLVAVNVVRLPQWADASVAEAAGFHSIGDALTGHEHYINWDWINDDVVLDPDHPESLVYAPRARRLASSWCRRCTCCRAGRARPTCPTSAAR